MLDKLYKAFALLKKDVSGLRAEVERISKVKPVARDGRRPFGVDTLEQCFANYR